jgi:hypothetical protein
MAGEHGGKNIQWWRIWWIYDEYGDITVIIW